MAGFNIDKLYLIAKCVLINKENKFLILKRTDYKNNGSENLWDIPGGSVDKNEDLNNAVAREVNEETQINLNSYNVFKIVSGKATQENSYIVFSLFYSKDFSGDIQLSKEHSEYKWIGVEEIKNYDFYLKEERVDQIKEFLESL